VQALTSLDAQLDQQQSEMDIGSMLSGFDDEDDYSGSESEEEEEVEDEEEKAKPMPEVPSVIREYLHLSASVVKIKFPEVQTTSEDLIKQVEGLTFFQYHDYMVKIMENQMAKITAEKKALLAPTQPVKKKAEGKKSFLSSHRRTAQGPLSVADKACHYDPAAPPHVRQSHRAQLRPPCAVLVETSTTKKAG